MARKRGYDRTHITGIICVSAAGQIITRTLLWTGQTIPIHLFSKNVCEVVIKPTNVSKGQATESSTTTKEGWSSAALFMEWIEKVFVKETQPLHNDYNCVVLILDGSKTHLSLEIVTNCRALGVHIVLFPPHLTDVVQPFDTAVFRPLKPAFTKMEKKHQRQRIGRASTPRTLKCF